MSTARLDKREDLELLAGIFMHSWSMPPYDSPKPGSIGSAHPGMFGVTGWNTAKGVRCSFKWPRCDTANPINFTHDAIIQGSALSLQPPLWWVFLFCLCFTELTCVPDTSSHRLLLFAPEGWTCSDRQCRGRRLRLLGGFGCLWFLGGFWCFWFLGGFWCLGLFCRLGGFLFLCLGFFLCCFLCPGLRKWV